MGIKVRGLAVKEATEWGYVRLQCTDLVLHANVFLVRKFEYLRERGKQLGIVVDSSDATLVHDPQEDTATLSGILLRVGGIATNTHRRSSSPCTERSEMASHRHTCISAYSHLLGAT
jgi:hypothetical protein